MEQPQEAAPEAEPQCRGRLGLVGEAGIVEPELLEGVAQIRQLVAVDGEQPAEHHRVGIAVAVQGDFGRVGGRGDGLTGAGPAHIFDPGDQVADLTGSEFGHGHGGWHAHADLFDLMVHTCLHEPEPVPGGERSLHHPDGTDHASILVVGRVEDEGAQRSFRVTGGCGDAGDDGVEQLGHTFPGLGRDVQDLVGRQSEHVLDLGRAPCWVGGGQVDLVEHGDDLEVVLQGLIAVGQGLGLNPLGGIH